MSSMHAELMDGAGLAAAMNDETAGRARRVQERWGRPPCLVAVLVGDDPASATYVRMKRARSRAVGIESRIVELDAGATTAEVVGAVCALSEDDGVDGILLQHPVPAQVDERAAFEAIAGGKDVDGVTTTSFAAMAFGLPGFVSCTPGAIIALLDAYGVELAGRRAVVVGRSPILGKPVAMILLARDASVTICHSRTRDLASVVGEADVVVAAVGKPELVRGSWLKQGAVVVDAGYNAGSLGDVAFDEAVGVASRITPVPGGVGPVTIAMLLRQTAQAAETSLSRRGH
jgi:methylenetetrahydrofolate dehydrogenase (NADP+)/methenyltetrahydrofolate cyclohydrolase